MLGFSNFDQICLSTFVIYSLERTTERLCSSCGLHGPYIFYKAYKFHRDGKPRILSLGDFFFVRCKPGDPICIAELQLLWEERTTKQLLSSSKLYFLPEDTPLGRTVSHGEHEVIAVSEKVIVRLEDLVKWTVPEFSGWAHGLQAAQLKLSFYSPDASSQVPGLRHGPLPARERFVKVLVLSYPQYCRYRSVLARLREQPSALLMDHTVLALGGIASLHSITRILYCRDTFEHPTLLQNESICDKFGKIVPQNYKEYTFLSDHFQLAVTFIHHNRGTELKCVGNETLTSCYCSYYTVGS
uniref:AT-rich interaction domain 5B n=1 Tax=Esox lucius TaxID=8010 RepID=A0A3P8XHT3_ESOLU